MSEKLQGLLALTWSVLTRLFREGRLKRLTALIRLTQAAQLDLVKTMDDIENGREQA